jgi:hypothetical protein
MPGMLEQIHHIHRGHVKNGKASQQTAHNSRQNDKATIPQSSFKYLFK